LVYCGLVRQNAAALIYLALAAPAFGQIEELHRGFEHPPDDARIMMRWWWFGSAVKKPELERELKQMKEGGIGGVEIQPVYPLSMDDTEKGIRNLPYLSSDFLDAVRFTSDKAHELGMRVDITLGSGWPYGGVYVPANHAASRLRWQRVRVNETTHRIPLPYLTEGEQLISVYGVDSASKPGGEVHGIHDGAVWLAQDHKWHELWFFIASRTGQMVKRPSVNAEGFVLDHYDLSATQTHLKLIGERLMQAFNTHRPYSVFCDSLEVYGADWTNDFLQEFQKRRGYDLKPHLPALVSEMGDETRGVRHDWGKTLTELADEHFITPIHDWAKSHETLFRIQAYGMPPATISSYSLADLAEGEGPQWKILRASRWASSASHLYGRTVTSSETWTWLHSPVFAATPLDMKAEADMHFLQGINQLIGHGWPYSPETAGYPGWRFYAAAVLSDKNPWWIVMPDLTRYLQRVSYLMRQGKPANDVALYMPDSDAWSHFTPGRVSLIDTLRERIGPDIVARILEAGYNLDFFDDQALGVLQDRYRMIILPNVESIPLATLKKFEQFAQSGGIVVATGRRPSIAPGLNATPAEHEEVRAIAQRLFEAGHFVKDENKELGETLARLLQPDLKLSPVVPEIGFVHRKMSDAEIYFVANTGNVPQSVKASFRVDGLTPELWDPMTGKTSALTVSGREKGVTTVQLSFEPYGSRVLVFSTRVPAAPPEAEPTALAILDVSTGWQVTFGERGQPIPMDRLRSWTENEDTRFYSGIATYEKTVTVPPDLSLKNAALDFGEGKPVAPTHLSNGVRAWLDAPVREAAVVYVNGQRAGSVWMPPYVVDVTGLLKPGENKVRVVAANLALNALAGQTLPDYHLLNLRYGVRFEAQDMDKVKAQASGLLGPIRLIVK
jgi:hypothetical protein